MSKYCLFVVFPELPDIKPKSIKVNGSDDVKHGLELCAARFEREYQEDMRLLVPRDLSSKPFDKWYERTRQWIRDHRDSLNDYTLDKGHRFEQTSVIQDFDKGDKILHLLLITEKSLRDLDEPVEFVRLVQTFSKYRSASMDTYKQIASPSATVKSPESLENASESIFYGRPVEKQPALQPALYNRIIAEFMYELETLDTAYPHPSPDSLVESMDFFVTSNKFFPEQKMRFFELSGWRMGFLRVGNGLFRSGSTRTKFGMFEHTIVQVKNEVGLDGDAFSQAILSYARASTEHKDLLQESHLPAILIGIAGNMLTIGAAIFTDAVSVSTLLTMNLLIGDFPDTKITQVARIASAVSTASDKLDKYYKHLSTNGVRYPFVPDPTPIEGELPKLRYTGKINKLDGTVHDLCSPNLRSGALFTAEMDSRKVVVKFTASYNVEAHKLLADNDLAPTLHLCTKLKGGYTMVIMDEVLDSEWVPGALTRDTRPMEIHEQVAKAVQLLHDKNLVFGDLRPTNMMYIEATGRVQLVDFDWVGEDGVARYLSTLDRKDFWPSSMVRGGLMSKQHDVEWLDLLKRLLESGYEIL